MIAATPGPLQLVIDRWRTVIVITALVWLAGASYYLLSTRLYKSSGALIASPRRPLVPPELTQRKLIPEWAPVQRDSLHLIAAVLESASVTEAAITALKLQQHYGDAHIEHTRARVHASCPVTVSPGEDIVRIACEDVSPAVAHQLVVELVRAARATLPRVYGAVMAERRAQLETLARESTARAVDAKLALERYAAANHLADLELQIRAVAAEVVQLYTDLIATELQRSYVRGFATTDEAFAAQLARREQTLRDRLHRLLVADPGSAPSGLPAVAALPQLVYTMRALARQHAVEDAISLLYTQLAVVARVEEVSTLPSFEILEEPRVASLPSKPRRALLGLSGVGGLWVSLMWILASAWWRGLAQRARLP